jgi:cytidyltransferase-like protein
MNKIVAICGKFDPLHNGHLDHIIKASKLGDYLLIITHTDEMVARTSNKGVCFIPFWARKLILEGVMMRLGIQGNVILSIDTDGTVTETIKKYRPNILAKGGDRTPNNMPDNEIAGCKEVGCEVMYGIGDLLNSSSDIVRRGNE